MQPDDDNNQRLPAVPDLPDAALPSIEPVQEEPTPAQSPPQTETPHNPLLPKQPPAAQQKSEPNRGQDRLSSVGKKYFKYIEFDDEETLLTEIRKHPFGLFIILFIGLFISFILFIAVTILASSDALTSLGFGDVDAVVVFVGFMLSLLVIAITLVNAHLYRNNVVFVTNEKIAQVLFITLFNRKISQLSIGDVQDVTVQQNGFIPNTVGYGTLVIETAGEQQNYTFTFVPNPYETSKVIINSHESNLKLYGN